MARRKDIRRIKEFRNDIADEIEVDKIILIGSKANETDQQWSDYDLIIVSPSFEGTKHR